ncbi:uncharacterized protein M421DRAFT_427002 [Didymella exigua CBS 183.55]|uniref:Uncharacterized protein n=1 Tax=Didymella exigua CBS 183.55 TaxID=1150837 RepID=A0A6A5R5R9_9PLEO|nr:uncharacterized protein M421DRAFT_427002 [Didymella exigua CBS 183.55]KAF1922354.1 hypothetical protein M421DRAFT_427002 [Didymella exigua CBS 183.55]
MADDALESDDTLLTSTLPEEDTIHMVPKGYRRRGEKAPQDVNLDLTNTNLIILGKT